MEEVHYLIGNSCNLNCDFCFWDKRMPDQTLDFKKKIIDQIVISGIKRVTLSGGEPLCTSNFLEVLEYMHKKGLEVILHTNGLLINKVLAKKISPFISRISLTIDAVDPFIQSKLRNNNSITSHTLDLINIFQTLKVPVNIKTLVTKINKDELDKIGKLLSGLSISYWSLLEFIPLNRGKVNTDKFLLSAKEFDLFASDIKNKFPLLNINIKKFSNHNINYCFIAPNGDVYTHIKDKGDVLVGNLNNMSLSEIIKKIENSRHSLKVLFFSS